MKKCAYKDRKKSRPSGSVPPASSTSPRAFSPSGVSRPETSSSSCPSGGQGKWGGGGSPGAPGVVSGGAPSPPARSRSSERGGSVSGLVSGVRGRARSSPSPSEVGEVGAARSQQTPPSHAAASVVSPHSSPHVQRRGESRETSESHPRVLSSRGSRSSDRGALKDKRARSRSSSSRGRRRRSRSLSSSRLWSRGRERRRRSSSRSLSSRARCRLDRSRRRSSHSQGDRSRSSDRYRPRRDRFRRDRLRSSDRYWSRRQRTRSPARRRDRSDRSRSHALSSRSSDRSRSRGRQPASSARSRAGETGRLTRQETQEGAETVVSQPPVASEVPVAVTPAAGGAALSALPSAVQDLARFFLSLSGSSSQGAVSGIVGMSVSAAGSGGFVFPPAPTGDTVTTCTTTVTPAVAGVSPAASTAVPGVFGEQQRQVESRSRRRRSRSSSEGTDRRSKKRARRRSPSPGPSSCRRGRHYRSSSDSSGDDRADVSPPRSGREPGGAPGGTRSSRAYDHSPRPGTSRSFVRDDRYRSGAGRRSPAPSGAADDDWASAFESVDFDRDDSFRSVLGLIRSFHGMEEPAGIPSARCKTALASAYGLMSEVSPAFTLPASPLVRSLLDDTNLALAKFLEDQTVHGFLPVPGRRHRRYYRTSSSSFPGPYTVPPGVTSITLEKVSEAKKRSVALSVLQVSSLEAMLSGVCEVSS